MKIYVSCDMEGTAGVVNHELQCLLKGEHYKQARRLAAILALGTIPHRRLL